MVVRAKREEGEAGMAYDKDELGTFDGSVYYSKKLPKDKGKVKYDSEVMRMLRKAELPGASRTDVGKAQEILAEIGYIEPSQIDSFKGPITMGAIQRYKYSASGVDRIYEAFETWKDNLFGD